jgi:hypothetical protein
MKQRLTTIDDVLPMKTILTLLLALTTCASHVFALELHALFTDNMMLQRDREIRVYGKASPGKQVQASFAGNKASATADQTGSFMIHLPAMNFTLEGQPLTVDSSEQSITLENVLVGDVWIGSGQSNMGWATRKTLNIPKDYPNAQIIRLFRGKKGVEADSPQDQFFPETGTYESSWQEGSERYAGDISAVGYHFVRTVAAQTGIPQGLVVVAKSQTSIKQWTPPGTIDQLPEEFAAKYAPDAKLRKRDFNPAKAYKLYNGSMHPLTQFPIKGMVWYQAENDAQDYDEYALYYPLAVKAWRAAWAQGDFPVFFVQLPGWPGEGPFQKAKAQTWPYQREAQEKAIAMPGVEMAVTVDLGSKALHPPVKGPIGERLALHAIALEKPDTVVYGPVMKDIQRNGKTATIRFESVGDGLRTQEVSLILAKAKSKNKPGEILTIPAEPLAGFEVCGADKVFYPAKAEIVGPNQVTLTAPAEVAKIEEIRYAFAPLPQCNLFNALGNPARPFRTDAFPFESTPVE